MLKYSSQPWIVLVLVLLAACQPVATPTPTPTETFMPTASATPTLRPTLTPSVTPSPTASATPTVSATSTQTETPTITPTPSNTPGPSISFIGDTWERVEFSDSLLTSLTVNPFIAFVNENNRDSVGDVRTPQPATGLQTLYYVSPGVTNLVPILEMSAATGNQIYIAPTGDVFAYFRSDTTAPGLYVVDLAANFSSRAFPVSSMNQRGFSSVPVWSPNGASLAFAVATGYDMDIITVGRDGLNPRAVAQSGAYEFFPAWSPDGQSMLFVSDRATCPSWLPGEPNTCDGTGAQPPIGGNLYVLDVGTGQVNRLSNQFITEQPRWINNRQISFSSGDPAFGDPQRTLWLADIVEGSAREIRIATGADAAIKLGEAWTADASLVLFQVASDTTEIVLVNSAGAEIGRLSDLLFPRFGMTAAWSPDGRRVAIGGTGGQCPFGVIVLSNALDVVARGNPPPSMCDPTYSRDGRFIAFTGINPRLDGRIDVYFANSNGFGAQSVSASLRGQNALLGWVGGTAQP
jgi:Tol biopolymer transport system component